MAVSKTSLVADLTAAYDRLNNALQTTKKLSADIAANIKASAPGGGDSGNPMVPPPGSGKPSGPGYIEGPGGYIAPLPGQGGGGRGGDRSGGGRGENPMTSNTRAGRLALGAAALAMSENNPSKYIENYMLRTRAGFFSGQTGSSFAEGPTNIAQAANSMMMRGTSNDPMDAIRAIGAGNSMGLMTGLSNYSSIAQSAATFSNVVPGAGLQGGMRAVGALNQARSVNMLRMIGVRVRGDDGLPRSFEQIADDLWNMLKKTAPNATAEDLSRSLLPGNSLDNLLNQYFGEDPVLRQGVITALFQKARGGNLSKNSLTKTGALPDIASNISTRNAAAYKVTNALTSAEVMGVGLANNVATVMSTLTLAIERLTSVISGGGPGLVSFGAGITAGVQTISGFGDNGSGSTGGMGDNMSSVGAAGSTTGPVSGYQSKITSNWHEIRHLNIKGKKVTTKPHGGMDIGVKAGTSVKAVKNGKVVKVANHPNGFGKHVVIQHDDGKQTLYGHLQQTNVAENTEVTAGTEIGKSGNTGFSSGDHLHFQVQDSIEGGYRWQTSDPAAYLAGASSSSASSSDSSSSSSATVAPSSTSDHSLFGADWNKGASLFTTPLATTGGMGDSGPSSGGSVISTVSRPSSGVIVNINVSGGNFNEEKLAREVKRILQHDEKVRMAVTR